MFVREFTYCVSFHVRPSGPLRRAASVIQDSEIRSLSIAKESARFIQMFCRDWVESQQFCEQKICGYGIIAEQNCVQSLWRSIERSIALHSDDPVSDHEVGADCRTYVQNALVYACPMEDALWPAVS